jgi:outer membrane protein TolC
VKRIVLILMSCLFAVGCSADWARSTADRQVSRIVRDRERQTLGYAPQVDAEVTVSPVPPKSAYAKVPSTPKPPPTTSPIEPSEIELPYTPLGPKQLAPSGTELPGAQDFLDLANENAASEARLGPPPPVPQAIRLDLFGSLAYAVHHSRQYKSQMEDLYLAALDVTLQRHLFEPRPFARTGLHYAGAQEDAGYAAALTVANSAGIRQQLPYGGELVAQATADFVRAISGSAANGEPATVALSASIPLLRGAGLINLEPLINSERQIVYTIRSFEDFRRGFAVNVASQYFRLLSAQQSIVDRRGNLESLRGLTERTRAMYAAQRAKYIDVQRALQEQLQAENDLVVAQADYQSALDDFKLLVGMPVDESVQVMSQELQVNVPKYTSEQATNLAYRYRLDLKTAQDQIEDAQRGVRNARNGLLPDLTLTAQAQAGNSPDTPASHFNNNATNYSAAVDLDLPLDRVQERNALRRSLITLERAERSYDQLKDQVAADARNALRSVQSAEISLEIQRRGIDLARLRLENANELLRLGTLAGDNRDVVDAQQALLRAQDAYEQARANLQIQVLTFLRSTGSLRVDPSAGAIGSALDRQKPPLNDPQGAAVITDEPPPRPPTTVNVQ